MVVRSVQFELLTAFHLSHESTSSGRMRLRHDELDDVSFELRVSRRVHGDFVPERYVILLETERRFCRGLIALSFHWQKPIAQDQDVSASRCLASSCPS